MPDGTFTVPSGPFTGGAPIGAPPRPAAGGASVEAPGQYAGGQPVGGPSSIFNVGGAPIAVLGGVFSGGLPIGGPVTQIFRGGSAPVPPTLFINTLTPSGPIGPPFIGSGGAPIGVDSIGGGGLPIGPSAEVAQAIAALQPPTASVAAPTFGPPPSLVFGGQLTPLAPSPLPVSGPPIGGQSVLPSGGTPIGPGGGELPGSLAASGGILPPGGPIGGGGVALPGGRPIGT